MDASIVAGGALIAFFSQVGENGQPNYPGTPVTNLSGYQLARGRNQRHPHAGQHFTSISCPTG
jgi:hypothetical protein